MRAALLLAAACLLSGCASTDHQISYGLSHYQMGLDGQAIPPLLSAAKSLESTRPPDPRLPRVLLALGTMAERGGKEDLAGDFYRRALTKAETLEPRDDTQVHDALTSLGLFYTTHKRAADAVPLLERAAAISASSPDRVLYAIDLDNLGSALHALGRYQESDALSTKALGIVEASGESGMQRRTRGVILYNLASSYMSQKRYAEAEPKYRESLAVLEGGAPRDVERWRVRAVLRGYADLMRKTGREEEARALERRAEQLR